MSAKQAAVIAYLLNGQGRLWAVSLSGSQYPVVQYAVPELMAAVEPTAEGAITCCVRGEQISRRSQFDISANQREDRPFENWQLRSFGK